MDILQSAFLLILGILLCGKGSDWLTDSLIPLARKLGVSGVYMGLILVSVTISLPEILISIYATLQGHSAISLGVVIGSIICNIGLMTGLCAIVRPLHVHTTVILRDGIFSIVIPILIFAVASSGGISRFEGFAFLLLFVAYALNVYLQEKRVSRKEKREEAREIALEMRLIGFDFGKMRPGLVSFLVGVAVLLIGSFLFGHQLIFLAQRSGIGDLAIGLTLGALGPSIPNIMAAWNATMKGKGEIAVTETFGSNIFTLLVTLGISALIAPIVIPPQWLTFDLPVMVLMSTMLFVFVFTKRVVTRLEGMILLTCYLLTIGFQLALSPGI